MRKLLKAVAYLRMSDSRQDTSIEQQKAQIEKWAKGRYQIVNWYKDEGKSGSRQKHKRVAFARMLADIQQGKIKVSAVITLNMSRFTREDSLDSAGDKKILRDAGLVLDTVQDGKQDWSSEAGQIIDAVHTSKNSKYSKDLSQYSLNGKINKLKKGIPSAGGQAPYGLCKVATDPNGHETRIGRLEKFTTPKSWHIRFEIGDKAEADVVRWIFEQYASRDRSLRGIAIELNKKNIASPQGNKWSYQTVRKLLRNHHYVGDLYIGDSGRGSFFRLESGEVKQTQHKDEPTSQYHNADELLIYKNAHSALITRQIFNKVARKLASSPKKGTRQAIKDYPLTGILFCGHCGHAMYAKKAWRDGKIRYMCSSAVRGGECPNYSIAQEKILPFAVDVVKHRLQEFVGVMRDAPKGETTPNDRARSELAQVIKQIEKGKANLTRVDGDVFAMLADELKMLQQRRTQLEKHLAGGNTQDEIIAEIVAKLDWLETIAPNCIYFGDKPQADLPAPDAMLPDVFRERVKELGGRIDLYWNDTGAPQGRQGRYQLTKGRLTIEGGEVAYLLTTTNGRRCTKRTRKTAALDAAL